MCAVDLSPRCFHLSLIPIAQTSCKYIVQVYRVSMRVDIAALRAAAAAYPKPATYNPSYGTAGFRTHASLLASTVFRCGLLAAARTILAGGNTGLMITASHNPVQDNGVKMVEPDGGMLPQDLEPLATELANAEDADALIEILTSKVLAGASLPTDGTSYTVIVGHDTRPSAPGLLEAALAGVRALHVHAANVGPVTTPQLHFLVHLANAAGEGAKPAPSSAPVQPDLDAYYDQFLAAFTELAKGTEPLAGPLYVDCANGIGGPRLSPLVEPLAKLGITLNVRNSPPLPSASPASAEAPASSGQDAEDAAGKDAKGVLNHLVGADFVQKERVLPQNFEDVQAGARCCCFDGDADRIVYFQPQADGSMLLFDGDRIAALLAVAVKDLLDQLPAALMEGVQVCCVQTAYANGASTHYLEQQLSLPVVMTPTGVKYLHEAAHAADVGIYFEANGHGTVLFSHSLLNRLKEKASELPAAAQLLALARVINQTVGDAISGLLVVELVLRRKGWGLDTWAGMYADLPSRQLKLKVANRYAITTTDAERRCVTPEGLQGAIEALMAHYPQARAFARPSGTEDAVRVYAEAQSQALADELANKVAGVVYDMAGGVGTRP